MTESEWFACTDPTPMLEFVQHKASERKRWLFYAACCRQVLHLIADERGSNVLAAVEQFADAPAPAASITSLRDEVQAMVVKAFLERMETEADTKFCEHPLDSQASAIEQASYAIGALFEAATSDHTILFEWSRGVAPHQLAAWALGAQAQACFLWEKRKWAAEVRHMERRVVWSDVNTQADLLRDVVGNPFAPILFAPEWLTSTAMSLSRAIHQERTFELLPILADALQDAGCPEESPLLCHCRGPGPHVRGCWAVDAVLGRS